MSYSKMGVPFSAWACSARIGDLRMIRPCPVQIGCALSTSGGACLMALRRSARSSLNLGRVESVGSRRRFRPAELPPPPPPPLPSPPPTLPPPEPTRSDITHGLICRYHGNVLIDDARRQLNTCSGRAGPQPAQRRRLYDACLSPGKSGKRDVSERRRGGTDIAAIPTPSRDSRPL